MQTKSTLIHGGVVKLVWQSDNSISVTAEGEELKEPKDLHDIINGEEYLDVPIAPSNVHAYYIFRLLDSRNINLYSNANPQSIAYTIKLEIFNEQYTTKRSPPD